MDSLFKVLLVEDLPLARLAIKTQASFLNWHLSIVGTGKDAILSCTQDHYDVVLMDLGLPDMSGIEAAREIRRHSPEIIIVALTAHLDDDNKQRSAAAGMNGYISKPFTLTKAQEIVALCERTLKHSS